MKALESAASVLAKAGLSSAHGQTILPPMDKVKKWSDVPPFTDEKAESEFWKKHELDSRVMSEALTGSDQSDSTTITIRFDPRMLARLKRIARSRYLNYQSMIKQWLAERLEEENRKTHG